MNLTRIGAPILVRLFTTLAYRMNNEKQTGRLALRWCVAIATILPIVANAILIVLFENGHLGRCDGIWLVGRSFMVSIAILLLALAGTGVMICKRQREPLWILVVAVIIQVASLTVVVLPFVR